MLTRAENITDAAIEQLEQGDAAASLVQALDSRQRIFLAAIEKANEMFEEKLRILRIDSLTGVRSSEFGKAMEPFYTRCIHESERGSHARRKAIIREALQGEVIFTQLMTNTRDKFLANSRAIQSYIQEVTADYLRVVEDRFDLVRSENVARESEQDPDFRLRVDEGVRTGRQIMQRVLGVI
jgi:hypothetical protein